MSDVIDRNGLTPRELDAWRGMLVTYKRVIAALDDELEREHGLPLGSYEVLLLLAEAPGHSLRMSTLADGLLLSRSGLTRLVDRLGGRGLVERDSCPDDRRGTFARLTPAGLELFERARPTHLAGVREHFLGRLDERDLDALAAAWEKAGRSGS